MSEISFNWNEETKTATCTIPYKDQVFIGEAHCHPEDEDMASKLTGQEIAEHRATIKYLRFIRDYEIKPELRALKQLYYTMEHSLRFNPKSYENTRLQASIHMTESDLVTINKMLNDERQNLYQYINQKDAMYRLIRSKRFVEGQEKINRAEQKL